MGMKELSNILERTSEIEKHLKPARGSYLPGLKIIYKDLDFQTWKTELKRELQMVKQDPLIVDILQLLDKGFRNGYTDEKNFIDLKGKLNVLSSHLDDYFDVQTEYGFEVKEMKQGTTVKTAFDEYTLIEQVGLGGNGKVFSATSGNGDSVAIKFVERNISADKLKRFKNEIHFCECNEHKNIVEILDRGYVILGNKEYVFYVMPLYAETLREKMKSKINPEDAITIFVGLLEGLGYAHKLGTIHRDIKPENIMFKVNSVDPIICDFGIAHFAEDELLTIIKTKKSDRMANFQYAAPEQRVKGEVATAQTDIYAAALILNEMFTNEIPQAGGYKTIASVAPDYKYLDDVFEQLFKQNASDRLYPEETILTEMKVRAEQHKRELEKDKLQAVVNKAIAPEQFEASIVSKEYRDGSIVFIMDRDIPQGWFEIMTEESFSHTSVVGYETHCLKKGDKNELCMRLRGNETLQTIKNIASNVYEWVLLVNEMYSNRLKEKAQEEQRKKEAERKAAIEKIEKENELAAIIASL